MMSKLNWFSGGKERSDQALALITEILRELDKIVKHYKKY